jgi:N utilization substance protein B
MLNRRHLRIKVLQALYAYFQSNEENYPKAEKEMLNALDRIYDLYLFFLLSFSELKVISENQFEERKKKIRPTEEDLNPNLKLVNNRLIQQLEDSFVIKRDANERKVNWEGAENQEMFRKIFAQIKESETYFSFMSNEIDSYEEDRTFLIELFKAEIANSEILYSHFEEENISWIDDIDLVCSMVVKTLKNFTEETQEILPLYKDKEDELFFIKELFRKTINLNGENEVLIDELTKNWELDRIAKMDVILMKMAITEMQVFSNVPTKVTLNEYIEISKFYSTPKSNTFINGVLDKAIDRLTKDEKIKKTGRGLMN